MIAEISVGRDEGTVRPSRRVVKGITAPRLAPPVPARSLVREYEAEATELGIALYPWQKLAARYMTALDDGKKDRWRYTEVCIVVARQQGKTELLVPRILMGLKRGETILHTAQNREIPRKTFLRLAGLVARHRSLGWSIRKGNGQEEIWTPDGGRYKLVAPNSGSRGESADLVLIDEVREQRDRELMDAMLPTVTARPNAQIIYLSNAGDDSSAVLNDLRARGTGDATHPRLAYLEWSADPELDIDDPLGWAQANPALGRGFVTIDTLRYFRANAPEASFETEHLCRWVVAMSPRVVTASSWDACRGELEPPRRPVMAVNMDPSGTRASAVLAWQMSDGTIALRVEADVTGAPIDGERFGRDLRARAMRLHATEVVFDPYTDRDLARYLPRSRPINGIEYANASERFARLVDSGRLRHAGADQIGEELAWTGRRETGRSWMAVRDNPDHTITSVLAAIRAAWVASEPRLAAAPRIF